MLCKFGLFQTKRDSVLADRLLPLKAIFVLKRMPVNMSHNFTEWKLKELFPTTSTEKGSFSANFDHHQNPDLSFPLLGLLLPVCTWIITHCSSHFKHQQTSGNWLASMQKAQRESFVTSKSHEKQKKDWWRNKAPKKKRRCESWVNKNQKSVAFLRENSKGRKLSRKKQKKGTFEDIKTSFPWNLFLKQKRCWKKKVDKDKTEGFVSPKREHL